MGLMERCTGGFASTFSANSPITDSAAAATALASGVKTNNGMVGVAPDGSRVESILEQSQRAGKSVGLITTVGITHATPACFAAHVSSRGEQEEIAAQMVAGRVDLLLGGGRREFIPQAEGGTREDGRNLLREAQQAGYALALSPADLAGARNLPLLGLFAASELGYAIDRPQGQPTLAEMTAKAVELLSRDGDGFFLMVEGGMIDFGAHANDLAMVMHEVLAFDEAIGVAAEYAAAHPDMLLVVTGDHETGGLSLTGRADWAVVAGQGGSIETALTEAQESARRLYALLRIAEGRLGVSLTARERARVLSAAKEDVEEAAGLLGRLISQRAGVSWSSFDHTAAWVPLVATGAGSERVRALQDNTDVTRILRSALGVGQVSWLPERETVRSALRAAVEMAMHEGALETVSVDLGCRLHHLM